jgi:hypothetical protein
VRSLADPSIFLLQDPEVSIWALQKKDAPASRSPVSAANGEGKCE